ncbi:PREDICTED: centrosomal protein of 78 kDa-like isoform X1 [Amphimedon queenslandica]|nr:PREDICTED: centrosomal protein of 78 kDa-like isoform X1 [Amphimedon queenslandica]|eukprot:XP_011409573.2 PREDICTED: centrosomal protein of 78 kDa-like isoform X1 [Amphimedon queenslandica]
MTTPTAGKINKMEAFRKAQTDFCTYYDSLCALQNSYPLARIRDSAAEGLLNCQVHKMRRNDWCPVLTALRANRIMHTVIFTDKWEENAQHYFNDDEGSVRARLPMRLIAKRTDNETVTDIIRSVRPILSNSDSLTTLLLEGLQMDIKIIKLLAKGLYRNQSLKHLSLKGSGIGDKGLTVICQVLKNFHCLEWIDFTWCHLTAGGMNAIADMIRFQSIHRQSSVWKDSLRGGHFTSPSTRISGLKRITLNLNPNIRDSGATLLVQALEDDVWIKALDMQTCGLTSNTAHLFQSLLRTNKGLLIIDIRENALMDDDEVDVLMEMLSKRQGSQGFEKNRYEWLDVEISRIHDLLKTAGVPIYRRRKKPSSALPVTHHHVPSGQTKLKRKGQPWRTAARPSQRWKNSLPSSVSKRLSSTDEEKSHYSSSCISNGSLTNGTTTTNEAAAHHTKPIQVTMTMEEFQQLQSEVVRCHNKLREEEKARLELKTRLNQLEEENKLLLSSVKEKQSLKGSSSSLDDEAIQTIEGTFKQFNAFLDLLNEKGYSHLTKLLSQS